MSEPSASHSDDETETMNVSPLTATPDGGAAVGAAVSRYVVLEEIGRGGMGRVLRAYDPKLQREVALKEVHLGGVGREGKDQLDAEATARLVAEARAMAKLSHPNVVGVYDVEESSPELPSEASGRIDGQFGTVVLVMEYVAGQTLRQWLREETRAWPEVVKHFIAAGRGLVAAHEAGLLHRDFKPANVLVSSAVKVTDFGLAKARTAPPSGPSSAGDDELTEVGPELPSVASGPELPSEASGRIDGRIDGWVLGTPRYMAPEQHRGESLTPAVDQYAFCVSLWEALCGEPPFSGKTMTDDKAAGPPPWPQKSTPRVIVDAIVRGLSPRAVDRWPTMAALLEALAYDPARRRNRWLLRAGALGVLGVAGASYGAWAEARAQRCTGAHQQLVGIWDEATKAEVKAAILGVDKSFAPGVWTRTQHELDAYGGEWVAMHTEACEATAVRGEQSPQMMDLRMGCLSQAAQELRATVETLADADDKVVHNAHKLTGGLRPLSRCADTEALAAEVEPPLPEEADVVEAARLELARSKSLARAGRFEAAHRAVQTAKDALAGVEYGPVRAETTLLDGIVLERLGRFEASEAALTEALELASRERQWREMARAANYLMFVVGNQQGRMEEGLRYRPLAEGLSRGRPEERSGIRNNLAALLHAQGRYAEAEAELREGLALGEKALGPDHPELANTRNNLASVLDAQGKYAEAEAEHRAVLSLEEKAKGPDHPDIATSRNNLAIVLEAQGKYAEAEQQHRAALSVWEKALSLDHPNIAASRHNLASVLDARGKYAEAEAEYQAALSLSQKALGPNHPHVAMARSNLAGLLLKLGRPAEALPLAEQAWVRRQRDDIPKELRAGTALVLAQILWNDEGPGRDRRRAHQLAEDALRLYRDVGEARAEKAHEAQQWLDAHPLH